MSAIESFEDLKREFFKLYKAKKYAEGGELLAREHDRFPDELGQIHVWQACVMVRLDKPDEAFDFFKQKLANREPWPINILVRHPTEVDTIFESFGDSFRRMLLRNTDELQEQVENDQS